jgi:hypothetical protein
MPRTNLQVAPAPALPATAQGMMGLYAFRQEPNLRVLVTPIFLKLWEHNEKFRAYLSSTHRSNSPSGKIPYDDAFAAELLQKACEEDGNPLLTGTDKKADFYGHLNNVCLRSFKATRKQRRHLSDVPSVSEQPAQQNEYDEA